MNVSIILSIMFILVSLNAQASIIILKDGRMGKGDIIGEGKKTIILKAKADDSILTYYKDEIVSIDGEPFEAVGNVTGTDAEKGKLVEQFLEVDSTRDLITEWVARNVGPENQKTVLLSELKDKNLLALTNLRRENMMKYYSVADLKTAINFYSSAEGIQFRKDDRQYRTFTNGPFYYLVGKRAVEAAKKK